jgi:hypothetical protein
MTNTKLTVRFFGLCSLVLAGALFSGCAWKNETSKYMTASLNVPASPPAGKALVCIHRPSAPAGHSLYYAGIWDDMKFIADLGNANSVAYVCEPGRHYLLSLFPGETSCVEAQLLPDKTYDLWIDTAGVFATFKLKPLHQDDKTRRRVANWIQQDRWIEPASPAAAYEQAKQDKIRQLLEDFTSGKLQDKLQHLAPDDHR